MIAIAFLLDGECAGTNGFGLEREAEAAGVHLDGGARGASEQSIDGDIEETAADVPEGVVDGADGHHEESVAGVTVGAVHLVPEFFAGERVFADKEGAKVFVDHDGGVFFDRAVEAVDAAGGSDAKVDCCG